MKKALVLALVLIAPAALADQTVVLRTQTIYGRAPRPLVAIDVAKLPMKVSSTLPAQALVPRIEPPVAASPF